MRRSISAANSSRDPACFKSDATAAGANGIGNVVWTYVVAAQVLGSSTAHRLFLGDEEARQVLRKVLMLAGIKGFDAMERGKNLLLKPIDLFAHDGWPSA